MSISFNEKNKVFMLNTPNSTYSMQVVDGEFLMHLHYGSPISDESLFEEAGCIGMGIDLPSVRNRERMSFMDMCPFEYGSHGVGDYRESGIGVVDKNGHPQVELRYKGYQIIPGKRGLEGMPALRGEDKDCDTLIIEMYDKVLDLTAFLSYTVYKTLDVIVRSVKIVNNAKDDIKITRAFSMTVDLPFANEDYITLHGVWARERQIVRRPLTLGKHRISSLRGEPGHQGSPFMCVLDKKADNASGHVYGFNLIYSGNFLMQAEVHPQDQYRVVAGINDEDFSFILKEGESFQTPEAVMVYSAEGIDGMSHNFHDLYRNYLIRGKYRDSKRPILINNWEATYFNFNEQKLIDIAREAKRLGIEMLVMDDGWFGKRSDDDCALGDWYVNTDKLKGGLEFLVGEVNKLGMKFGIWFEPEMISPDSDLYREHPDWAFAVPNRETTMHRCQYVLDYSRKEVRDYVYGRLSEILHSANIEYVKWDMNRNLSNVANVVLPAERQGELFHRYVLGVYELQERLINEFPDLLLENCSGGGARFDAGMLYYSPQIWCSDDADAMERLKIQESTALVFPLSTMGAHVAVCPNHTVGRTTPFKTRGDVALAGTFGYELDITKLSEEDKAMVPVQVANYHKFNDLIRRGDYYRLASFAANNTHDAYMVVAKDKSEALVTFVEGMRSPSRAPKMIRLRGLDPKAEYLVEETGKTYHGDTLMNFGFRTGGTWGDFNSFLYHLVRK